ncbi:MAG: hypothetical protein H6719_03985 [Sandaracinaceae bacterium]|nr:hypothetical protein [Sandaracinaceae bacterium]
MRLQSLSLVLLTALVGAGCDGGDDPDGGMDAALPDASLRDAARPDAPPAMCTPECDPTLVCCDVAGATGCFDLRNDPRHCGECDVDCIGEARGDGCSAEACTCGSTTIGCTGMREDFCCPPRGPTGRSYCANLTSSTGDCGECGVTCNPARADRCGGGVCRCGAGRDPCAGTPESMCCTVGVDVACVDTTNDTFHCGRCDNLCPSGERCENSTCTSGASCPAACGAGEICCDGTCCTRRACMAGVCGVPTPDAGVMDAGVTDAGVTDADVTDADVTDADVTDAGVSDAG